VHDRDLLDALFTGRAQLADRLAEHMAPPLPMVGAGEPVQAAMVALEKADAAVVVADGRPHRGAHAPGRARLPLHLSPCPPAPGPPALIMELLLTR
jgi:hypothetical protein